MLDDPIIKHTVIAMIIIAACGILGRILKSLLRGPLKKIFERTQTTLDDQLIDVVSAYVMPLSIVAGLNIGIREVRKVLTPEHLTHQQILDYLSLIVFFALVIIVARLAGRLVKATLQWYMEGFVLKSQHAGSSMVVPSVMKIVNILLFFIASLILLDHVGVNVGSLLVSLGVGSLAVALAAQETISNMIAWFVIILDQPFQIGDTIKLPSGEEGNVYQIGLRATRILNYDYNLIVVPNGDLVKARIVNLSAPTTSTRVLIDLGLPLGTDVDLAKKLLLRLAGNQPDIYKDPPPEVVVANFGETGIQMRLMVRAELSKKGAIETLLREQIYRTFNESGISLSLPQRIVHISNAAQTPQTKPVV